MVRHNSNLLFPLDGSVARTNRFDPHTGLSVSVEHNAEMESEILSDDNIPFLNAANQVANDVLKNVPEKNRGSRTGLDEFLNVPWGRYRSILDDVWVGISQFSKEHLSRVKKALRERRRFRIRSFMKAAGICAGITCIVNMSPMLISRILKGDKWEEIRNDVRNTVGPHTFEVFVQGGAVAFRAYLRQVIGYSVADTAVGTLAVEAIVAIMHYLLTNSSSKVVEVLSRLGGQKVVACIAAVFPLNLLVTGLVYVVKTLANTKSSSFPSNFLSKLGDYIRKVFDFVTAKWGAGMTIVGTIVVLASQVENAVMLVGTLGAAAGTGVPISALSGAAAKRAALAWLGGGPLAAGGGGMAAGTQLLATLSFVGSVMQGIGVIIMAYKFFEWVGTPSNLDDLTQRVFDVVLDSSQEYIDDPKSNCGDDLYEFLLETLLYVFQKSYETFPWKKFAVALIISYIVIQLTWFGYLLLIIVSMFGAKYTYDNPALQADVKLATSSMKDVIHPKYVLALIGVYGVLTKLSWFWLFVLVAGGLGAAVVFIENL